MDVQFAMFGIGGVLVALLALQVWRTAREDMSRSAVSETWLAERKRMKDEQE